MKLSDVLRMFYKIFVPPNNLGAMRSESCDFPSVTKLSDALRIFQNNVFNKLTCDALKVFRLSCAHFFYVCFSVVVFFSKIPVMVMPVNF